MPFWYCGNLGDLFLIGSAGLRSGVSLTIWLRHHMDLTPFQIEAIRVWAIANPRFMAVRLFGSRAKGLARDGSDVDLAITVGPTERLRNGVDSYTLFVFGKKEWSEKLSATLGLVAHLEMYDEETHPKVHAFCSDASIVLWERGA